MNQTIEIANLTRLALRDGLREQTEGGRGWPSIVLSPQSLVIFVGIHQPLGPPQQPLTIRSWDDMDWDLPDERTWK